MATQSRGCCRNCIARRRHGGESAGRAQPLHFLEYLLEAPERAVTVSGDPILVNVPACFALHKLVVAAMRPAAFQAKAAKDRAQAVAIAGLAPA
jgi:hypothetical protein